MRTVVGGVLEGVLWGCVEAGERLDHGRARESRRRRAQGGLEDDAEWEDWWDSVMNSVLSLPDDNEGEGSADERTDGDGLVEEVRVESHTNATMKGIIHTTETIVDPASTSSAPDAEPEITKTVIAVGAGAQLFPGKGGPHSSTPPLTISDFVQEEVDGVKQDVQTAAAQTKDAAGDVTAMGAQASRAREGVDRAARRLGLREGGERARMCR